MMQYSGELAALGAAYCWSWTAIFFTAAGTRIGSFSVNVIRLCMAFFLLGFTTVLLMGTNVTGWYAGGNIPYLILSGVFYINIDNENVGRLVKLGSLESHKPQDKMVINKGQVMFWENLRLDSPVVKTIQGI